MDFLLILKWIFIILGILLGLVLLFMALVLCVPVRYRAAGDNHEKIQYSFKVSWLLSIIAVKKKKRFGADCFLCVWYSDKENGK